MGCCSLKNENRNLQSPSKVAVENIHIQQEQNITFQQNQTREPKSNDEQIPSIKKSKYTRMISNQPEQQIYQNKEEKNAIEDNFFEKKKSIEYVQKQNDSDDDY